MKYKILIAVSSGLVFVIIFLFILLIKKDDEEVLLEKALYSKTMNKDKDLFYKPRRIRIVDNKVYVLDFGNNRIIALNKAGEVEKEIGKEGQGPGEFLMPYDFTINSNNEIIVLDEGNSRIQILDMNGNYLHSFRIVSSSSRPEIECDSRNNIYLNNPHTEFLFEVYLRDGKKIQSFGEMIKYTNPLAYRKQNMVSFTIDDKDNIYAVFPSGVIRKYKNYKLLKEVEVENTDMEFARDISQNSDPNSNVTYIYTYKMRNYGEYLYFVISSRERPIYKIDSNLNYIKKYIITDTQNQSYGFKDYYIDDSRIIISNIMTYTIDIFKFYD